MKKIILLGDLNKDLVSYVKTSPRPGETILGQEFLTFNGGKGGNQAVAMAKLGSEVSFIGAVGNDQFGQELLAKLKAHKIQTNWILTKGSTSGMAIITVDGTKNNAIIVHGGANDLVTVPNLLAIKKDFANFDFFVTQLGMKSDLVLKGLQIAKDQHLTTLLTPAPAQNFDDRFLEYCDYLIPNEHEFFALFALTPTMANIGKIARQHPTIKFLVTLGEKGVIFAHQKQLQQFAALPVEVVDTTAAGDSFVGGLVATLSQGQSLEQAIKTGIKCASITITRKGAQMALPTRKDLAAL